MNDLKKRLTGYSLVTAEILYRMPDYHSIIQTFIWQEYDKSPEFPRLHEFLDFWTLNLDGPLYKVTIAHTQLVKPQEITTKYLL